MAERASLTNLCTFEFLMEAGEPGEAPSFAFIEANPRLQVEHTVTEEVTGVDLVTTQIALAAGRSLAVLGLDDAERHRPRGVALQARLYAEILDASGDVRPTSGTLTAFEPPSGRGIRVETHGYPGYRPSTAYDALLAKLIVHDADGAWPVAVQRAARALREFRVDGVATNASLLTALLASHSPTGAAIHTRTIESQLEEIAGLVRSEAPAAFFASTDARPGRAGAQVDPDDPLAVLAHGKSGGATTIAASELEVPEGVAAVFAPLTSYPATWCAPASASS
jgi:biotin carboxylase